MNVRKKEIDPMYINCAVWVAYIVRLTPSDVVRAVCRRAVGPIFAEEKLSVITWALVFLSARRYQMSRTRATIFRSGCAPLGSVTTGETRLKVIAG